MHVESAGSTLQLCIVCVLLCRCCSIRWQEHCCGWRGAIRAHDTQGRRRKGLCTVSAYLLHTGSREVDRRKIASTHLNAGHAGLHFALQACMCVCVTLLQVAAASELIDTLAGSGSALSMRQLVKEVGRLNMHPELWKVARLPALVLLLRTGDIERPRLPALVTAEHMSVLLSADGSGHPGVL